MITTRRGFLGLAGASGLAALAACSGIAPDTSGAGGAQKNASTGKATGSEKPSASPTPLTPAETAARATVPVLCYHQVREYASDDSEYTRNLLVIEPARLAEHLDAITGAGYTPISAEQHYQYLTAGAELPDKPMMLTFDDGKDNQYTNAFRMLKERELPAMLYIMTVVIGQKGWVTKAQIKEMADGGFDIGSHTWDHHRVDEYTEADLEQQLVGARKTLEDITGKQVLDFAYPYGAWNDSGAALVKKAGYRTAYQLTESPVSETVPLLSLRRRLAASNITGAEMVKQLDEFATKA